MQPASLSCYAVPRNLFKAAGTNVRCFRLCVCPPPTCTNSARLPSSSYPYTSTAGGNGGPSLTSQGRNLRHYYWVGRQPFLDFVWLMIRRSPRGSVAQECRRGGISLARKVWWCGPHKGSFWGKLLIRWNGHHRPVLTSVDVVVITGGPSEDLVARGSPGCGLFLTQS